MLFKKGFATGRVQLEGMALFSAQKNSRSRKQEASADYLPTYFKVFGEVKVEGSNRRVVLVPEVDIIV